MVFPVYVAGSAMLAGIGFGLTAIGLLVGAIFGIFIFWLVWHFCF